VSELGSQFSGWVARLAQRFEIFRRRPSLLHMPTLEFGFRVVNALHRRVLIAHDGLRPRKLGPPSAASDTQSKDAGPSLVQIR